MAVPAMSLGDGVATREQGRLAASPTYPAEQGLRPAGSRATEEHPHRVYCYQPTRRGYTTETAPFETAPESPGAQPASPSVAVDGETRLRTTPSETPPAADLEMPSLLPPVVHLELGTVPLTPSLGSQDEEAANADGFGAPGEPDGGPEGPGGFGGPDDDPGYATWWYPSTSVVGQGTEVGLVRNRLGIDVPVWFKGADAVMLGLIVDNSHFSGEAILPDTHRTFPKNLWNISLGLKHMHQFANGWTSMLMFDVGSASDEPFHAARDMSYTIGGFLMIPARNARDKWMLGAIYSPFGSPSMPFPIPLISYNWRPSERLTMNIGLPADLTWAPTDRFSIKVDYMPLTNINAIGTYKCSDDCSLYGGYQYVNGQYLLSDRVHALDTFVTLEQQLVLGARRSFGKHFVADVSGGYAFGRQFGVGQGMDQTNLNDKVELDAGVFLAARLKWNF